MKRWTAESYEARIQRRRKKAARNPECACATIASLINPPKKAVRFSRGAASPVRHIVKDGKQVDAT